MRNVVISLFDYTGVMVRPWAEAGYICYCFDLQHGDRQEVAFFKGGGAIYKCWADLGPQSYWWSWLSQDFSYKNVAMLFGFPPCTDLAGSGARHWKAKAERNPSFQDDAARMAIRCAELAEKLSCPYMVENPTGALTRLWRKWDHKFNPCDYGGYLPEDDAHPLWPEVIPPRDAYTKATCLWTGGGYVMPNRYHVVPVTMVYTKKDGTTAIGSPQWGKLGGKSVRTKNIRSATPRGFAKAVFISNSKDKAYVQAA